MLFPASMHSLCSESNSETLEKGKCNIFERFLNYWLKTISMLTRDSCIIPLSLGNLFLFLEIFVEQKWLSDTFFASSYPFIFMQVDSSFAALFGLKSSTCRYITV